MNPVKLMKFKCDGHCCDTVFLVAINDNYNFRQDNFYATCPMCDYSVEYKPCSLIELDLERMNFCENTYVSLAGLNIKEAYPPPESLKDIIAYCRVSVDKESAHYYNDKYEYICSILRK